LGGCIKRFCLVAIRAVADGMGHDLAQGYRSGTCYLAARYSSLAGPLNGARGSLYHYLGARFAGAPGYLL
jgi:hypothetical protein